VAYLIKGNGYEKELMSLPCGELNPGDIKSASSELAQKILGKLAVESSYPKELSRALKVHEQKIYYHIRKLEKAGLIKALKSEIKQGAVARYYGLTNPSFSIRFKDYQKTQKIVDFERGNDFFEELIENGKLNALVVIGDPNPHGSDRARSRDGAHGVNLGLILGTFMSYLPRLSVRFDTEMRKEDLKKNLIVIGGPIVNNIANRINAKMPIRFVGKQIHSKLSKKKYSAEETGLIVKSQSPFDKRKKVIWIAGIRSRGTRACVVALLRHFSEISEGNKFNPKVFAKVVEGADSNSDGLINDVEIKE
jgi:DNA-binding transcriptional ArsR family regulator